MEEAVMKQIIDRDIKPIMTDLFQRISEGGLELEMDGVPVYNEKAQFVAGKVINHACYTVLELIGTEESQRELGRIIRMVSAMKMETWGILNGITGLYRLKKAGLLESIVDKDTLLSLKKALDWRTFVDIENHYALIGKPTNYYGVAFGIARYRELLGWEPEEHSRRLLDRLLEHIEQYSGELCFMDETPGDGRFDRYSILVPAELTSLILETGWKVPERIRIMLKKSAHIFLQLANEEGTGFSYGRSIGAYGDTAALEVLSAAAELGGILTEEETEIAYGYSMRLLKHIAEFWYDRQMNSMNMWEKGRRTDQYRNKNRILGENISLCMQMVNSYEHWIKAGYEDHKISGSFSNDLCRLASCTYMPFAEGEFARGLVIVRDRYHVWSLPFVNGSKGYYDKDAYMPVPFQNMVLQGVPGCSHKQLVPQLILEEGTVLMPLSYFKTITVDRREDCVRVRCCMNSLCRMDESGPQEEKGFSAESSYTFEHGRIRREDQIRITGTQKVKKVRLVLLTYSEQPQILEREVRFGKGILSSMKAEGYESCMTLPASDDGSYNTPHGRLNTEVIWEGTAAFEEGVLKLGWTIGYKA